MRMCFFRMMESGELVHEETRKPKISSDKGDYKGSI
jgi:hypothetical protein